MAPLLAPTFEAVKWSWRRLLSKNPDPPIGEYIQSNQLLNCELVSTSQVQDAPVGTILEGQAAVTVTAATISASSVSCIWVMLQADEDNTDKIRIGNSGGQHWQLSAGATMVIPIDNVASIIADADSGTQALNWIAGVM